jgi:hypothetical protein
MSSWKGGEDFWWSPSARKAVHSPKRALWLGTGGTTTTRFPPVAPEPAVVPVLATVEERWAAEDVVAFELALLAAAAVPTPREATRAMVANLAVSWFGRTDVLSPKP